MLERKDCPRASGTISQVNVRKTPWDVRSEQVAQDILNDLPASADRLGEYEDELNQDPQVELMRKHDSWRARYRVVKQMRKTGMAALSTLEFAEIMRGVLPALEAGEPISNEEQQGSPYTLTNDALRKQHPHPIEGSAAHFAHGLHTIISEGLEATIGEMSSPNSDSHSLWESVEATRGALNNLLFPTKLPELIPGLYTITEDNVLVVLELMSGFRLAYQKYCEDNSIYPDTEGAVRYALKYSDHLAWPASANRSTVAQRLHAKHMYRHMPTLENLPLASIPPEVISDPLVCYRKGFRYNHASLVEQPWTVARWCPAVSYLQPGDNERQDIVRRFKQYVGNEVNGENWQSDEDDPSFFSRSQVVVQLGALVARATLFAHWPLSRLRDDRFLWK